VMRSAFDRSNYLVDECQRGNPQIRAVFDFSNECAARSSGDVVHLFRT